MDFIRRNASHPFLAYYPMILPHDPFCPTPESEVTGDRTSLRDRRFFGDMVSHVDTLVGRIIRNLEDLGLREHTLLVFTSDNGSHRNIVSRLGEEEIVGGKGRTLTTATHVPLIVSRPGTIPAGTVCEDLIDFSDILPTLCDVAGIDVDPACEVDGRSFLPQLRGEHGNPREWIFCHYDPRWGRWEPARFVMDHRWKLYEDGRLFDLRSDPQEENPLVGVDLGMEAERIRDRFRGVLDRMR
jgi:arylsulfatase A